MGLGKTIFIPFHGVKPCLTREAGLWYILPPATGSSAGAPPAKMLRPLPEHLPWTRPQEHWRLPLRAKCIAQRAISPRRNGQEVEIVGLAPAEEGDGEMFLTVPWVALCRADFGSMQPNSDTLDLLV
jgi:hypothetical protein